ncbi:MAG: DUF6495 family protein [Crocinitomicaceae bacterium]
MDYRMLSREEMTLFDEDFKHYLIVNGIPNEAWLEMNEKNVSEAQKIVEVFSDVVLQKAYEKIQFLEFRSKQQLMLFSCEKEEIHLIGLSSKDEAVDFSTPEAIQESILNYNSQIQSFRQTKKYSKKREIELFEMTEQGCVVSTKIFWDKITKLIEV